MALSRRRYAALSPAMDDRIRPVHSSSRSRNSRSHHAIRPIFQFVTPPSWDHEIVNEARRSVGWPKNRSDHASRHRPHNIDHASLTPQLPDCLFARWGLPRFRPVSPKIPFFCPAVDTAHVLLAVRRLTIGEICHMNIKASGRSALIIAAAVWVGLSGPVQAGQDADGGAAAYESEAA